MAAGVEFGLLAVTALSSLGLAAFSFRLRRRAAALREALDDATGELARLHRDVAILEKEPAPNPAPSVFVRREPVSLHDLLQEFSEGLEPLSGEGVNLVMEIPPHLPPVYAEANSVRQAVDRLITRSAERAPSGSCVRVTAQADPARKKVLLELHDASPVPYGKEAESELKAIRLLLQRNHAEFLTEFLPGRGMSIRIEFLVYDALSASRDYFLYERDVAGLSSDRVALVLVRLDVGIPDSDPFLKRLETTLRSTIRKNDWITGLEQEKMLLLIGQMSAGEEESFVARVTEVVRREELAGRRGQGRQAGSSAAVVVFPTDGSEFDDLLCLARRRLDKGICWNIQPPA